MIVRINRSMTARSIAQRGLRGNEYCELFFGLCNFQGGVV